MKFKVRIAVVIINLVAMFCGLLIVSVTLKDRMKLAKALPLEKNKYEEVNALIDKYVHAKKEENYEVLKECVNNINNVDKEEIKKENTVGNKVENIQCYTIDGYYDNTYVVFIYQDNIWNKLNISVPTLKQVYVCEYKGKLVVYSGKVGDSKKTEKISKYIDLTMKNPDVQKVKKEVEIKFQNIIDTNETFKEVYDAFKNSQKGNTQPSEQPATPVPSVSADPSKAIG